MREELNFESGSPDPKKFSKFPKLRDREIIAGIRVIQERRPQYHRGNQFREALNVISGAGIDHAKGLNAEISSLAIGTKKLPSNLEREVQEIMPAVRKAFDRALDQWREMERGDE